MLVAVWQVQAAWRQLLTAADADSALRHRSTFQYDVVDVGRQVNFACSRFANTHPDTVRQDDHFGVPQPVVVHAT